MTVARADISRKGWKENLCIGRYLSLLLGLYDYGMLKHQLSKAPFPKLMSSRYFGSQFPSSLTIGHAGWGRWELKSKTSEGHQVGGGCCTYLEVIELSHFYSGEKAELISKETCIRLCSLLDEHLLFDQKLSNPIQQIFWGAGGEHTPTVQLHFHQ